MSDLLRWAARAGRGVVLELACSHGGPTLVPHAPGSTVALLESCFARTPVALPVEILACGVSRVIIRTDNCPEPAAAFARWAGLAEAFGLALSVVAGGDPDADPVPALRADSLPAVRRRGLFGLRTPGDPPAHPGPGRTDQQRLRAALRALLERGDAQGELPEASGPGIGLVLAASACELEAVCVHTCPEAALSLEHRAGGARLVLDPGACTGCGTCVASCPGGALGPVAAAPWASLVEDATVVVADVTSRRCRRCRRPFRTYAGETLCRACSYRRAQPFGSVLPEEVRRILRDPSGTPPR